MGKNLIYSVNDVMMFGKRAKLFSSRIYLIENTQATHILCKIENGVKVWKAVSVTRTEKIFDEIEFLYDRPEKGIILARRLRKNHNLISTGKGPGKRLYKPKSVRTLVNSK